MEKDFEFPDVESKSTISINIKDKHIELLRKHKASRNVSISAIIDKLIEDFLPNNIIRSSKN